MSTCTQQCRYACTTFKTTTTAYCALANTWVGENRKTNIQFIERRKYAHTQHIHFSRMLYMYSILLLLGVKEKEREEDSQMHHDKVHLAIHLSISYPLLSTAVSVFKRFFWEFSSFIRRVCFISISARFNEISQLHVVVCIHNTERERDSLILHNERRELWNLLLLLFVAIFMKFKKFLCVCYRQAGISSKF